MVFITGRSALLGKRLQNSVGKGKQLRQIKKAQSRCPGMQEFARGKKWVLGVPPVSRLSDPAHVYLSSQQ